MDLPSGRTDNSQKPSSYFPFALAGAVLMIALGFFIQQRWPVPSRQDVRLTMLCVSGFSWERVMPLHQQGQLPYLASLFNRSCSYGDIISTNFTSDAAITATLVTGLLPHNHKIYEAKDLFDLTPENWQRLPIWHDLAGQGERCVVIGFPLVSSVYGCESGQGVQPENRQSVRGADIEDHVQYIASREALPPALMQFLRACVSSDTERIKSAVAATAMCTTAHLFVYFEGLGRWQQRLTDNSDVLSESLRADLIDRYYIFFDTQLAAFQERLGEQEAFFLLSERGNLNGCPGYWKDFPLRNKCPATGFFYATGRHIREGIEPLLVKPADIVPTLVYLSGRPVLNTMNGIVDFDMLKDEFYFQHKLTYR